MSLRTQNDRGTVLLTTLLIMTVMAAITVALMEDIRFAVKRTVNVHAYAQADWQASGAEDFVTAYLTNDFAQLPPIGKAALLQSKTPLILPTPAGQISLTLKDASQCFNLNSLIDGTGTKLDAAELEFVRLAELLGLPQNQAVALSKVLADWQDGDQQQSPNGAEDGTYLRKIPPYRTSDTALRGPEEMRALHGMDEDLWELFKPFVCTGEPGLRPPVNVNSLSVERLLILVAALSSDNTTAEVLPVATSILRDRPLEGYSNLEQLQEALTSAGLEGFDAARIGVDVEAVFVEVTTEVGPAERVRTYRFDGLGGEGVDTDTPRLTYRGWGRETFRPELKSELETEQDAP